MLIGLVNLLNGEPGGETPPDGGAPPAGSPRHSFWQASWALELGDVGVPDFPAFAAANIQIPPSLQSNCYQAVDDFGTLVKNLVVLICLEVSHFLSRFHVECRGCKWILGKHVVPLSSLLFYVYIHVYMCIFSLCWGNNRINIYIYMHTNIYTYIHLYIFVTKS